MTGEVKNIEATLNVSLFFSCWHGGDGPQSIRTKSEGQNFFAVVRALISQRESETLVFTGMHGYDEPEQKLAYR